MLRGWILEPDVRVGAGSGAVIRFIAPRSHSRKKHLRLRNTANIGHGFYPILRETGLIPRDSDHFPTVTKKNYINITKTSFSYQTIVKFYTKLKYSTEEELVMTKKM